MIVIGTGLEESMVAACAARNGHTVLHLDHNNYYGDQWAAFNLDGIRDWIKSNQLGASKREHPIIDKDETTKLCKDGERLIWLFDADEPVRNIRKVQEQWWCREDDELKEASESLQQSTSSPEMEDNVRQPEDTGAGDDSKEGAEKQHGITGMSRWSKAKVLEHSRRFNLDLTPRLLYARGAMVELLISSNISRYTEFKSVSRVLTLMDDGTLEDVPSSRADVFATKHISVVEKRILMKFIALCMDYENRPDFYEAFKDKTFLEFLKHEKLTDNLIHFVIHSIAMVDRLTGCLEGLRATKKFMGSLGRFGKTPFLWSMYGSGELPQAFCRLCAVFGGTYYLGRSIDAVVVDTDSGKVVGVVTGGQRIDCERLVIGTRNCPRELKAIGDIGSPATTSHLSALKRKICLLSDSILPSEKEQLTFLSLSPENLFRFHPDETDKLSSYIYVQEVGHGTAACPKGMYVLHLTQKVDVDEEVEGNDGPLSLEPILKDRGALLWSLDFEIVAEEVDDEAYTNMHHKNVHLCSGPVFELDYDRAIENAMKVCHTMYPNEPFLPRAPDPEEIVIGESEEPEHNKDTSENAQTSDISSDNKDEIEHSDEAS